MYQIYRDASQPERRLRKSNAKSKRRFGFISTACVRMERKSLNHLLSASTWRPDGTRRTGPRHPSTLHLRRVRGSLAAYRAMLFASLLSDICDAHRPADFTNTMNALADA
jgi:hypothetical protein